MKRRIAAGVMATALSALALSACASSDGGSGDEAITLTFLNCHPGFK